MDDRSHLRRREMLAEAKLRGSLMTGLWGRLRPFAASRAEPEPRARVGGSVGGLPSPLERKTGNPLAYRPEQERPGMPTPIGHVPPDHRPWLRVLAEPVGRSIGEPDGVVVFDPSGFAERGKSVGVARAWCGRPGEVDNGQVGADLGYVSRSDHARVDFRLPGPFTRFSRCARHGLGHSSRR
jgi:hypothetical protein